MKFKIRCRTIGATDEGWWENYDKPIEDAAKWANDTIAQFNATLYEKEQPRELLEVVVLDSSKNTGVHDWKKTNSFTVKGRDGSYYDTMQCAGCGITAKRFGLSAAPKRDPQFKAMVYENCKHSQAHLIALGKFKTPSLATN